MAILRDNPDDFKAGQPASPARLMHGSLGDGVQVWPTDVAALHLAIRPIVIRTCTQHVFVNMFVALNLFASREFLVGLANRHSE